VAAWGPAKTRAALPEWPRSIVLLQAELATAEERLAAARTEPERAVALRAVSAAAAALEAAKRQELAR
jgi:hypothetical protein